MNEGRSAGSVRSWTGMPSGRACGRSSSWKTNALNSASLSTFADAVAAEEVDGPAPEVSAVPSAVEQPINTTATKGIRKVHANSGTGACMRSPPEDQIKKGDCSGTPATAPEPTKNPTAERCGERAWWTSIPALCVTLDSGEQRKYGGSHESGAV